MTFSASLLSARKKPSGDDSGSKCERPVQHRDDIFRPSSMTPAEAVRKHNRESCESISRRNSLPADSSSPHMDSSSRNTRISCSLTPSPVRGQRQEQHHGVSRRKSIAGRPTSVDDAPTQAATTLFLDDGISSRWATSAVPSTTDHGATDTYSPTSVTLPVVIPVATVAGTSPKPVVSVASTGVKPAVPVAAAGLKPVVPVAAVGVKPAVPVAAAGLRPVVPVAAAGLKPVLPVAAAGLKPVLPVAATTGLKPVVPIATTSLKPVVPVATTALKPVVPVAATGLKFVEPIAPTDPKCVENVATAALKPVVPVAGPKFVETVATTAKPVAPVATTGLEPAATGRRFVEPVAIKSPKPVVPVAAEGRKLAVDVMAVDPKVAPVEKSAEIVSVVKNLSRPASCDASANLEEVDDNSDEDEDNDSDDDEDDGSDDDSDSGDDDDEDSDEDDDDDDDGGDDEDSESGDDEDDEDSENGSSSSDSSVSSMDSEEDLFFDDFLMTNNTGLVFNPHTMGRNTFTKKKTMASPTSRARNDSYNSYMSRSSNTHLALQQHLARAPRSVPSPGALDVPLSTGASTTSQSSCSLSAHQRHSMQGHSTEFRASGDALRPSASAFRQSPSLSGRRTPSTERMHPSNVNGMPISKPQSNRNVSQSENLVIVSSRRSGTSGSGATPDVPDYLKDENTMRATDVAHLFRNTTMTARQNAAVIFNKRTGRSTQASSINSTRCSSRMSTRPGSRVTSRPASRLPSRSGSRVPSRSSSPVPDSVSVPSSPSQPMHRRVHSAQSTASTPSGVSPSIARNKWNPRMPFGVSNLNISSPSHSHQSFKIDQLRVALSKLEKERSREVGLGCNESLHSVHSFGSSKFHANRSVASLRSLGSNRFSLLPGVRSSNSSGRFSNSAEDDDDDSTVASQGAFGTASGAPPVARVDADEDSESSSEDASESGDTEQVEEDKATEDFTKPAPFSIDKPDELVRFILKDGGYDISLVPVLSKLQKDFFVEATQESIDAYGNDIVAAVRVKDIATLRRMHQEDGRNMQCCNKFGESILHLACRRGHTDVLLFLLEEVGVSPRVRDDYGRTPMHDACWTANPNTELMTVLLKHCPDLLVIGDKWGFTPFHYVRKNHWSVWCSFLRNNSELLKPKEVLPLL